MNMKKLFFVATLTFGLSGLGFAQQSDTPSAKMQKEDGKHFGETIDAKGSVSYAKLLKKMKKADSLEVKVTGTVNSVCQAKGCWMTLSSGKEGAQEVFVRFKDYGFFVPKDIAGRQLVMQGYAYREVTSVEELKHYAEDEGKSQAEIDAITQPKEELKFLANGVLLLDAKK
jgi:hypothetical protein